jgi:hypothetical protein
MLPRIPSYEVVSVTLSTLYAAAAAGLAAHVRQPGVAVS